MKKAKRMLSLITSLCMTSACFMSANALSVSNEQMPYESDVSESIAVENLEYQIVVAVNDDSVLLENGCALSQSKFQKYSGEDFTLKYGDIVNVTYSGIDPISPGQFVIDENHSIEYIGSASDVCTEKIKELTITKKSENNERLTLRDSDGNSYIWLTHIALITDYGYQAEIAPSLLNVGDVINCVVDSAGKEVILPVSITEDLEICMVVSVGEDEVLLSNDMLIYKNTFQEYSGENFNLKYGDVIGLANIHYLETAPMQPGLTENSYIKYLGSAEEYYAESMKNLTVTEISNDFAEIVLIDSYGQSYTWYTRTGFVDNCNVQYDIEPYSVNVGDVFNCITEPIEIFYGDDSVFPVSTVSTVEDVIGDANGDNEVTVRDCAVIASALATGKARSLICRQTLTKTVKLM